MNRKPNSRIHKTDMEEKKEKKNNRKNKEQNGKI